MALALATIAGGCALPPISGAPPDRPETVAQATQRRASAPRPAYNLTGYPPAVRDGYIDGCESAKRSEYARKDAHRMADDRQYAMGWNDGYSICKR
jgi:hypothetical protein